MKEEIKKKIEEEKINSFSKIKSQHILYDNVAKD